MSKTMDGLALCDMCGAGIPEIEENIVLNFQIAMGDESMEKHKIASFEVMSEMMPEKALKKAAGGEPLNLCLTDMSMFVLLGGQKLRGKLKRIEHKTLRQKVMKVLWP